MSVFSAANSCEFAKKMFKKQLGILFVVDLSHFDISTNENLKKKHFLKINNAVKFKEHHLPARYKSVSCCFRVEEAKEWVMRLKPQGGCNLLKAMKHIYKLKDIDSIVLILGSVYVNLTQVYLANI